MFKFIVKLHPEIVIKSKSVRKRFTMVLERNIKLVLSRFDEKVTVKNNWDNITVVTHSEDLAIRKDFISGLGRIPGIVQFLEVQETTFETLDDIYQKALPLVGPQIENKTFCVRVKRQGNHDFTSSDVERYVGGGLNQHVPGARVQLRKPDVTVKIEVKGDRAIS